MQLNGLIYKLPNQLKLLIGIFILVLSVGFYSGVLFVNQTSSTTPEGIVQNYVGNEDDDKAQVMKFKKSEREMRTIIHSHILSMALIFFLLGVFVSITDLPKSLQSFLMIEPLLSVLVTFGGIYFLWKGILWMKYIVMLSGILMTLSFTMAIAVVVFQLIVPRKQFRKQ